MSLFIAIVFVLILAIIIAVLMSPSAEGGHPPQAAANGEFRELYNEWVTAQRERTGGY